MGLFTCSLPTPFLYPCVVAICSPEAPAIPVPTEKALGAVPNGHCLLELETALSQSFNSTVGTYLVRFLFPLSLVAALGLIYSKVTRL